ncbi:hypothetical protein [Paenibacillus massiliensis]|uniref:hypothetical protein n=2 Tax=Paenibacillus TaxID=44249 RepID=UPI0018CC53A8|nr:hypothetical protein [Paenibacillus massiliensis]
MPVRQGLAGNSLVTSGLKRMIRIVNQLQREYNSYRFRSCVLAHGDLKYKQVRLLQMKTCCKIEVQDDSLVIDLSENTNASMEALLGDIESCGGDVNPWITLMDKVTAHEEEEDREEAVVR